MRSTPEADVSGSDRLQEIIEVADLMRSGDMVATVVYKTHSRCIPDTIRALINAAVVPRIGMKTMSLMRLMIDMPAHRGLRSVVVAHHKENLECK